MKNSFKLGFLAIVIAVSAAACVGTAKKSDADSLKADSLKKDSIAKLDTSKKAAADTSKKAAKDTSKKK